MAAHTILDSLSVTLRSLGVPHAAASAVERTANAFSCESSARAADATRAPAAGQLRAISAGGLAERGEEHATGAGRLPDGFVPVGEAKNLALQGRWPLLEDKMPGCLPLRLFLSMQRRCEHGEADATAWMRLYQRAFSGEADAQRDFGRVCENGAYRAPADLQRAFFWYYRAALQGDVEARYGAERLARSIAISPAAMAEPALVYPGSWRITAAMPGGARSASHFELAGSGAAAGCLIGSNGAATATTTGTLNPFCGPHAVSAPASSMDNTQYKGKWAYYHPSRILSFEFAPPVARKPGNWSDTWQIQILGCRMGALYGRDRRTVSYFLEQTDVEPAQQPVSTGRAA